MFVGGAFTAADYDQIPRFNYHEESLSDVVKRVALPVAALALLILLLWWQGLREYRRFPGTGRPR